MVYIYIYIYIYGNYSNANNTNTNSNTNSMFCETGRSYSVNVFANLWKVLLLDKEPDTLTQQNEHTLQQAIKKDCNVTFELLCGCERHPDKDTSLRDFVRRVPIPLESCVASTDRTTGLEERPRPRCSLCFTPSISRSAQLTISTTALPLSSLLSPLSSHSLLSLPGPMGRPLAPVAPRPRSRGVEATSRGGSVANVTNGDAGGEKVPVVPRAGRPQMRAPPPGRACPLLGSGPGAQQLRPAAPSTLMDGTRV